MNVIAKKIARSLGQFSVVSITPTENPDLSCPLCGKKIEGHFVVFNCDHFGCKDCVDRLADEAEPTDPDTILTCPICFCEVKNLEYK